MKLVKITVLYPDDKREIAKEAARKLHNISLHFWLQRQIDSLIRCAREQMPDRFGLPVELKPIDRIILQFLTMEGRHTDADLASATGLRLVTVRNSLSRLVRSGLVDVRDQGGKPDVNRGGNKKIYISVQEL